MARLAARAVARIGLVAAIATTIAACSEAPSPAGFDDAGYWRFADLMQTRLDDLWSERDGYYKAGSGGVEPLVNANMLITHAVAAMRGHQGAARQDHRARRMARRLVASPPLPVGSRIPLASVDHFHVISEDAGYIVRPLDRPAGATAHTLNPAPQASAPRPGPTLAIQLARVSRFTDASLAVRLTTVPGGAEATPAPPPSG